MLITFLTSTTIAFFERKPFSLDLWSVVASAETAAWRLKWVALPVMVMALWAGARICASVRRMPSRFAGARFAHAGLMASTLVALMMITFIGITVPERLRQRQRGIEAASYAQGYTIQRALLEYQTRYRTLPTDLKEDLKRLPDPDGSIAAALSNIDPSTYQPRADVAALPKAKTRSVAFRRVSTTSTDDSPVEKVSFTNYELRLPGPDKISNTDDDWIVRDGVIIKPSPSASTVSSSSSMGDANTP
jgi:hypothetical protein